MTLKTRERSIDLPADSPAAPRSRKMRFIVSKFWYQGVRYVTSTFLTALGGFRASGTRHLPRSGGVLLVSNHLSYLDVFVLGLPLPRMLNFVARSTLFLPILGPFIRSVGAFPIQREGIGASGLKETLRRLRNGGVVALFPEGTRSLDGELAELKQGIATLAARTRVPVVPAGIAGTFEAWPRNLPFPLPRPIWVHFGPPIFPEEFAGLDPEAVTAFIRERLLDCQREARRNLRRITADLPPTD